MKRSKQLSNRPGKVRRLPSKKVKGPAMQTRAMSQKQTKKNKPLNPIRERIKAAESMKITRRSSRINAKTAQQNMLVKRHLRPISKRESDSSNKNKKKKNVMKMRPIKKMAVRKRVKAAATRSREYKDTTPAKQSRIVRIMGHGQFTVNSDTLKRLNEIDSSLVQLITNERFPDAAEFKRLLSQLNEIVQNNSEPLDPKEIIQSDIILPSTDLSIEEAKKLFTGQGVIPEV
jgi:PspAA-like protein